MCNRVRSNNEFFFEKILIQSKFLLQALSREVPSHDPKFTDVKEALGEAEHTGASLSKAADTEEQDIPLWNSNFMGVECRWNDVKNRLEERINMLTQLIPKLEKGEFLSNIAKNVFLK